MLKRLLLVLALLVAPVGAQTGFWTDRAVGTFPVPGRGGSVTALIPVQFGQVRVCTNADIGGSISPCPDVAAITDTSGNPLSVVGGNFGQIKTDVGGRFSFGCTAGNNYLVQVAPGSTNVPLLSYPISCPFGTLPGGNLVVTNPIGNALQTITGPLSLGSFGLTIGSINNTVYCNTTLNAAVAAVTAPGTIIVPLGSVCPTTANLTVPTNVTLVFYSTSTVAISNLVTLTINGPILAPQGAQLFSYTGSGVVALGPSQQYISAAWFPGTDWAAQYNNADTALGSNPGTIRLPGSMTSTTAATVFHPSNNRYVIFDCGTWLTNVATRAFNLNSNAVTLEGCANGGTLGTGTNFDNKNATSITMDIGDTTGGGGSVRGLVFSRFSINQDQSSGVNIRLRNGVGNVSFTDLFLGGSVPGNVCVDGTDGNYILITFRDVRATTCKNYAYNFGAALATGNIAFYSTYASGTVGSPATGYNLSNGLYSLYNTAADSGVNGYDIGAIVTMNGTEDEGNSGAGIRCLGASTLTITNHESNQNAGNPVFLSAAGCQVTIDNLKTISTTGAQSILVGSSATAECHIRGTAGLDKGITFQAGGNCKVDTNTAPTISSGFGTTPSIVNSLGPSSFQVNVGTGGVATSGVIGLPAVAANGWNCQAVDISTNVVTRETAFTATSATFTAAAAWTASDKLMIQCQPF